MNYDEDPNSWGPESEYEQNFDTEGSPCEQENFIFKTLQEIKYLEAEGFIKVVFHPKFPKDYFHATLFWKSEAENMKEIEHLLK